MQRILYILIYPLFWLMAQMPLPLLYIASDILYFIIYHLIGYRKKVVLDNLNLIFPQKSNLEKKTIAKEFFKHFCDIIFETIKNYGISEKEIRKRFKVTNIDYLQELYDIDKSVLLYCGHYASWEWSAIINKMMPHKGYGVYKKLRNPQMDNLVKKIRQRFGATIVSNNKIVPTLFRAKRDGIKTLTLILADQTPKKSHFKHHDTFMGVDVPVFTGSEELTKKLDFAALYLHVEKLKRGYYQATLVPIAVETKNIPDYQITRDFLTLVENQIKKEPAYYLWSHKRWKHRFEI